MIINNKVFYKAQIVSVETILRALARIKKYFKKEEEKKRRRNGYKLQMSKHFLIETGSGPHPQRISFEKSVSNTNQT